MLLIPFTLYTAEQTNFGQGPSSNMWYIYVQFLIIKSHEFELWNLLNNNYRYNVISFIQAPLQHTRHNPYNSKLYSPKGHQYYYIIWKFPSLHQKPFIATTILLHPTVSYCVLLSYCEMTRWTLFPPPTLSVYVLSIDQQNKTNIAVAMYQSNYIVKIRRWNKFLFCLCVCDLLATIWIEWHNK